MRKNYPIAILAAGLLAVTGMMMTPSCANTTEAPSGGAKDTIPPYIVDIRPLPGSVAVPLEGTQISFTFNEYVTLKNPKSIFLSPPQQKSPVAKIKGKSVVVSFEEPLLPGRTYTIELNDAIADANEGNPYAGFTYAFSTGEAIDSMYVTGNVMDCATLQPVKDATVLFYKDHSDSALFLHRPDAAAVTDDWGYFSAPFLQDTLYRIYAIKEQTRNNIYDPDSDLAAFLDSLYRPKHHMVDSVYELMKFNMKDTLECLARKTDFDLLLFREKPSKQYIMNKERTSPRSAYVTFLAPFAWIDSIWVRGYRSEQIITQFNIEQDSLELWINDHRRPVPDTLGISVGYRKTDSLGRLVQTVEKVNLPLDPSMRVTRYVKREIKPEDTTCVFTLKAEPETVEQDGFKLEFRYPVINADFSAMTMKVINPKQKESFSGFTVEQDSLNLRCYRIRPDVKMQVGYDYILKAPYHAFRDITGFRSDSTECKVTLPTDEDLSSLNLAVSNVDRILIIDLMDEKRTNVLRTFTISRDSSLLFSYLKEGRYCIRITADANGNSIVDTGSILQKRQPEPVFYVKFSDNIFFDIPKATELDQSVDFAKLLNER